MRRAARVVAALLVAAAAVPWATPAAQAAEATLRVDKQGWYWRHAVQATVDPEQTVEGAAGRDVVPCPIPQINVSCPSVPVRPSPFEPDHLLVGRFGSLGSEDQRDQAWTLILFDLSWLEPGSEVQSASVTLEESNDDFTQLAPNQQSNPTNRAQGHPNRLPSGNLRPETAKVRACPVFEFWGGTQPTVPSLWDERPAVACDRAEAVGVRRIVEVDGRFVPLWTFDITPIARLWAEDPFSAQGIAFVPAKDATGDWMVSFHGDTYVVERDLVSQQDLSTTLVRRVFGTMRFKPPAPQPGEGGEGGGGPSVGGTTGGAAPEALGGAAGAGGGPGVLLPSPVNRLINVVRGARRLPALVGGALQGKASTPGYLWLPVLGGLIGLRLFASLFLPKAPRAREHRVAAAYRRLRSLSEGGIG